MHILLLRLKQLIQMDACISTYLYKPTHYLSIKLHLDGSLLQCIRCLNDSCINPDKDSKDEASGWIKVY
jgi:hypothetical protein